jgi:beta-lactamase regulating signal transducer with metallopeptidase domain
VIGWLVDTLIATSVLMALVLAVREPVRRRFGPEVAYALWLIPALRMALPPLTHTVERAALPEPSAVLAVSVETGATAVTSPALLDRLGGWPGLLIALWLAGAIILLVRGLLIYRAQRRAILSNGVQLARIGDIRLVRSELVRGPLAFGIIDPVVIVPLDFDQRFSECQRRLALDHELAHHRSGDLVANSIAFVLLCLQWFNPLAWAAHAAFRFDQEAACDARVLDKAKAGDRPAYGEAIAKAAGGRTLLFAGALDRPSTLSRRLTIMTRIPTSNRRRLGFIVIGGGLLLGLPLSASRAVNYVDVPVAPAAQMRTAAESTAPAPAGPMTAALASAAAPGASLQATENGDVVLPGGVTLGKGSVAFFDDDRIVINGKIKRLDQLTRAERSELRAVIAKSRRELEKERAELPERLAEVRRETEEIRSGAFKRELLEDREDLRRDLAEIDSEVAALRSEGKDPEKLKAEILEALREAEAIDIDKEIREALAELNPDKVIAELRNSEQQMVRIQVRLEQLDSGGN